MREGKRTSWKLILTLFVAGDEIFSINGVPVQGMTHHEAISHFKEVKQGSLVLVIGRRHVKQKKTVNFEDQ